MGIERPAHRIVGRDAELGHLRELLAEVRSGHSRSLVLRGEPGIGKSALLEWAGASAAGFLVLGAVGVESDMELPYAGLQQLCAPILSARATLPQHQRHALETALALDAGPPPERFLVGLAVAGMLTSAATDRPVLCLVDDVQWLDAVSAQTLSFVARRLGDAPVGIVFAARQPVDGLTQAGELVLTGLSGDDARTLLSSAYAGRLDDAIRDRIVSEARGNPLALLELPKGVHAAKLAGGYHRPDVQAVGELERHYARQIEALPPPTRLFLLLAAAEPVGDTALLISAARRLGMSPQTVVPAEAAGLIEMGVRARFRHPLMRTAAYRAGSVSERRQVHAALAAAIDGTVDPDRLAWHRAYAIEGTDADVAAELERSAVRVRRRGGTAAAAAFLTRSVELTADPATRSTRALTAAEALHDVASFESAREMLTTAALAPVDDEGRGRIAQLRARLTLRGIRGGSVAESLDDTVDRFSEAARFFAATATESAYEAHLEALTTAMYAGRSGNRTAAAAAAVTRTATVGAPTGVAAVLAGALAQRISAGPAVAMPAMRRAVDRATAAFTAAKAAGPGQLWLAFPIAHEVLTHEVWDLDSARSISAAAVRLAEDTGALTVLPTALVSRAGIHLLEGEFDSARALFAECDRITAATGHTPIRYHELALAAWTGDEQVAMRLIGGAQRDAAARGEGRVIALTAYATAVLHNGMGRYQVALQALQNACRHEDLGIHAWNLVELVESAARADETAVAKSALEELEERTAAAGTDWALGVGARSRALLSTGRHAQDHFDEALARLQGTRVAVHLARTHLLYGEWLRRENRRTDARHQLRQAFAMFTDFGAAAFADRARRELLATGEKHRKRPASSGDELTAQEEQIAELAAAGLTNGEIAAQMFISAHTVEWHLRKVFTKLGITSRRQLRDRR